MSAAFKDSGKCFLRCPHVDDAMHARSKLLNRRGDDSDTHEVAITAEQLVVEVEKQPCSEALAWAQSPAGVVSRHGEKILDMPASFG